MASPGIVQAPALASPLPAEVMILIYNMEVEAM